MTLPRTGSLAAGSLRALVRISAFFLLPGIAVAVPFPAGDANCNGVVDAADTAALISAIFVGSDCAAADVNRDGEISAPDLTSLVVLLAARPSPTATPTGSGPPGTATMTPSGTPAALGAQITFLAPVGSDGCEFCCQFSCRLTPTPTPAFDAQGRRIYERPAGRFLLVVEARPGASGRPPGVFLDTGPGQLPDLQALASNDLGDGSAEVCDLSTGGVPGVDPPDLDRSDVTDAMRDMACRFSAQPVSAPCTRGPLGNFAFLAAGTTRQYCFQVPQAAAFPAAADTVLAVRVSDQVGNPGEPQEIVIRVD